MSSPEPFTITPDPNQSPSLWYVTHNSAIRLDYPGQANPLCNSHFRDLFIIQALINAAQRNLDNESHRQETGKE